MEVFPNATLPMVTGQDYRLLTEGGCVIFCHQFIDGDKERTVGTTKLTRKEILAEDSVHGSMIFLVDFFAKHKKKIIILGVILILAALGIYGGLLFLENKEVQAQELLGRGIDFYHAEIDSGAKDDPYGMGQNAVFSSDSLKYQAAAKEFSSIVSGYGYSKVAVIARYYLGLTQLKQGKTEEAVENLEKAANNTRVRTVGYLAKNVLAQHYEESGNYEKAQTILESMIADARYDLPKDELSLRLARILIAGGERDEAVKILQEATSEGSTFSSFRQKLTAELEEAQKTTESEPEP